MNQLPKGHKYTPSYTPYHVVHLSVALLKATFSNLGDEDYPFKYNSDFKQSGIAIDTVYNREAKLIGKKPTIAIARGAVNASQISTGDHALPDFPRPQSIKSNLITSSVDYRVSARTYSECDILSNEVYNFLITCRTVLPKMVGILHVNNVALSPPMQTEQDDQIYVCTASFSYVMQYRWVHIDTEKLISSIHIFLNDNEVYNSLED